MQTVLLLIKAKPSTKLHITSMINMSDINFKTELDIVTIDI